VTNLLSGGFPAFDVGSPAWARTFLDRVSARVCRPEAFDAFGGWGGEMLRTPEGRFVLIDWPGLGAAPRGSLAALALEILLRFRATDPTLLVERFLAGWLPGGLDNSRLETYASGGRTAFCGGPG